MMICLQEHKHDLHTSICIGKQGGNRSEEKKNGRSYTDSV